MKRFLVFVIICIVSLSIGFTVFRFMTYEEVMSVGQTVYQVNVGEEIKLDVITEHLKGSTVLSTELTQTGNVLQKIDEYTFTAAAGGQATITLSSSSNLMPIKVQVTVGDGANASPFFIKNAATLAGIGSTVEGSSVFMPLSAAYTLTSDIILTNVDWTPIGLNDDTGFTGRFDFNGHKISGLTYNGNADYVGLFAKTGVDAQIFNGTISTATITADSTYVGGLVGLNRGDITNVKIVDSSIKSTKENSMVGGLVGVNYGGVYNSNVSATKVSADVAGGVAGGIAAISETNSMRAIVTLSSSDASVSANDVVGGLVGKAIGSTIENCYTGAVESIAELSSLNANCYIGGIVGVLAGQNSNLAVLKDTYAAIGVPVGKTNYVGAILAQNSDISTSVKNKIFGNYYSSEMAGVSNAVAGMTDPTNPESNDYGVYKKEKQQLIETIPANYKDENKISPVGVYYSCISADASANYYWNFNTIWQSNASSNQLPTIRENAIYTPTNLEIAGIQGAVYDYQTFVNLSSNANGNYTLTDSFTIDRNSGDFTPFDFNGTLIGEVDENGVPVHKITFIVNSVDQLTDGKVALFKTIGKNSIIQDVAVEIIVETVSVKNSAALALVNKGKLVNCHTNGSIATSVANETLYMAGLVSENYGSIQNCVSDTALSFDGAPSNVFVGGLVAYNYANANVDVSRNTANITSTANTKGYVGGIVGQSDGKITKCLNKGSISIQGKLNDMYVGGVVGFVNGSHLSGSTNIDNSIRATNVGGVVGYTTGYISECMSKSTLTGDYVGGIVCVITANSFTNCLSINHLVGLSDSSIICGIGYSFNIYKKASYATHIFSACTFGQGTRYYESASDVRQGDDWFVNYALCLESSIYVNDIATAKRSVASGEAFGGLLNWIGSLTPADIAGYRYDSPVTDAQAKGSDGYALFYENGFSTDIWLFNGSDYPMLKNAAK